MLKLLRYTVVIVILTNCQSVPEPAEKSYYISAKSESATGRKANCSFRYKLDNSFDKLNNQLQQQAVRSAFDLWQKANPNILFLQKQDALKTEILIRFEPIATNHETTQSQTGLIRGSLATLSSAQEQGGVYIISLDSGFSWDTDVMARVVAYHIGMFLGLENSQNRESMLNRIYENDALRLSQEDSIQLNKLYYTPCAGDCNNFLPLNWDVSGETTKSIRIDKAGKISIKATGSMIVGEWLGWSTPVGLAKGLGNVPIGNYSIDRSKNHAALIYKINHETNWQLCGIACEFPVDGISQCVDITFAVNDKDLTDNQGSYNVVVSHE